MNRGGVDDSSLHVHRAGEDDGEGNGSKSKTNLSMNIPYESVSN